MTYIQCMVLLGGAIIGTVLSTYIPVNMMIQKWKQTSVVAVDATQACSHMPT